MGLIKYILGSDSRSALKKLNKLANKVEELDGKYAAMSDAELKDQTRILKERLAAGETLDDIMFDAFAAFREASWRVLGMKHFHVQIVGGICLHQGRIAEMKTGEGKTLVSTLPAYLIYATNNELGFDYLRDNLKTSIPQMVQRELNYCIIDEVDSILIDEARTPLIISGKGGESSKLYEDVDKFVRTLKGGFDDDKKDAEKRAPSKKKKDLSEAEQAAQDNLTAILEEMENWDYVIDRKDKSVTISSRR